MASKWWARIDAAGSLVLARQANEQHGGSTVHAELPAGAFPALLDALLTDAPIIEIFHHGQKRAFAHGETERDMLNEMAMIVDPICVARQVEEGRYRLVKLEAPDA